MRCTRDTLNIWNRVGFILFLFLQDVENKNEHRPDIAWDSYTRRIRYYNKMNRRRTSPREILFIFASGLISRWLTIEWILDFANFFAWFCERMRAWIMRAVVIFGSQKSIAVPSTASKGSAKATNCVTGTEEEEEKQNNEMQRWKSLCKWTVTIDHP